MFYVLLYKPNERETARENSTKLSVTVFLSCV